MRVALLGLCAAAAASVAASPLTRVHVVPHSHNDPGWLETESQYFKIRSKMIITNVVKSLEADAKRRFQWVEMVYFREWWGEQDAATQGRVRALVAARRLIFLTGGLCMNDEAISHHGAVIDQMTWGHRFINETFGPDALPTVGWQIDAFGHGAGYTSLTAAMGIKAMIGQKIDFQDQARRAAAQELEFRWTADPTNHPNRSVFGHIMFGKCSGCFPLPQALSQRLTVSQPAHAQTTPAATASRCRRSSPAAWTRPASPRWASRSSTAPPTAPAARRAATAAARPSATPTAPAAPPSSGPRPSPPASPRWSRSTATARATCSSPSAPTSVR